MQDLIKNQKYFLWENFTTSYFWTPSFDAFLFKIKNGPYACYVIYFECTYQFLFYNKHNV
jgi:hypothetical protein